MRGDDNIRTSTQMTVDHRISLSGSNTRCKAGIIVEGSQRRDHSWPGISDRQAEAFLQVAVRGFG